MAQQSRPLTNAAQNFLQSFQFARQGQEKERARQDLINAAQLKREQQLDDRKAKADAIFTVINESLPNKIPVVAEGETPEEIVEQGIREERRAPGRRKILFGSEEGRRAFARSVAMDPSSSGPILAALERGDKLELRAERDRSDNIIRAVDLVQGQKTELGKQQAFMSLVESGEFGPKAVKTLVGLSNEPDLLKRDTDLERLRIMNTDRKIIIDEGIKERAEERAEQVAIRTEERAEQVAIRAEERKPLTKLGEINLDFERGFITPEQLSQQAKTLAKGKGLFSAKTMQFQDGTTLAFSPFGESILIDASNQRIIDPEERKQVLRKATQSEIDKAALSAGQKALATANIARQEKNFDQIEGIKQSIINIDDAIAALDRGAAPGFITNLLPTFRTSTIELENVAKRMGIDILGAVTFGSLSAGELRLALSTALPTTLTPLALRGWLVNRRNAQVKLSGELQSLSQFLMVPGNSTSKWLQSQKEERERRSPQDTTQTGGKTFTIKRKQ